MHLDVLAFGAHPDDIELSCAGTLIKLKKQGHSIGIIDLTRAELSTRGTVELRAEEAKKAAEILKVDLRENIALNDGDISLDSSSKKKVIEIIREYRPKIVFAPYWEDRHPDHVKTSHLITESFFLSGLSKISSAYPEYRPKNIIYFFQHQVDKPSFIVDISEEFKEKMESVKMYKSQFFSKESKEKETYISSPLFLESVISRAKYFGYQIGVEFGEPFFVKSAIKIDNIFGIFA